MSCSESLRIRFSTAATGSLRRAPASRGWGVLGLGSTGDAARTGDRSRGSRLMDSRLIGSRRGAEASRSAVAAALSLSFSSLPLSSRARSMRLESRSTDSSVAARNSARPDAARMAARSRSATALAKSMWLAFSAFSRRSSRQPKPRASSSRTASSRFMTRETGLIRSSAARSWRTGSAAPRPERRYCDCAGPSARGSGRWSRRAVRSGCRR